MPTPANPLDDPADAAALRAHADALVDAVDRTIAGWAERVVVERWKSWQGDAVPEDVLDAARSAGEAARALVVPELRTLLATDVDEQRTNPLSVIRRAVPLVTEVLRSAGVPPVARDEHAARILPGDAYDLAPAAFADLDPSVHEPGLVWGAAKAHVVLARRRREGRR